MGVTFGPGMVRALEERLAEVTAERDRMRDAIEAIIRHEADAFAPTRCHPCMTPWPCPTERAHIAAAATPQDTKSSAGSGCDGDHGAGPHAGTATSGGDPRSRPAPKDSQEDA